MKTKIDQGAEQRHEPWQIHVVADDDALAPVVPAGGTVLVDCSDRKLADGGIFAVREDQDLQLWLYHEGFAGHGTMVGGRAVGTLSSLAGTFRCRGPVLIDKLLVVGRVVEPVSREAGDRAVDAWQRERAGLIAALEETRLGLRRLSATMPVVDLFDEPTTGGEGGSVSRLARRFEDAMQHQDFARRFALEQRMDAVGARLMLIEECLADIEVTEIDDVYAKLQVLWDLHYAPFPPLQNDLAARYIASSLRGLAGSGRLGRERPEAAPAPPAADPPSPHIQLVTSPRRR